MNCVTRGTVKKCSMDDKELQCSGCEKDSKLCTYDVENYRLSSLCFPPLLPHHDLEINPSYVIKVSRFVTILYRTICNFTTFSTYFFFQSPNSSQSA